MLGRDDALAVVRDAYAARERGDKDKLASFFRPDAHFEILGDPHLLPEVAAAQPDPIPVLSDLIDRFTFRDMKLLDAVVDGSTVVARWGLTVETAGKPSRTTQICDVIKLDDEGKIASLEQFVDTALLRHLSA